MHPRARITGLMAWACCMATAPAEAQGLAADRAAIGQLVNAVSLDVMTVHRCRPATTSARRPLARCVPPG